MQGSGGDGGPNGGEGQDFMCKSRFDNGARRVPNGGGLAVLGQNVSSCGTHHPDPLQAVASDTGEDHR